MNSETPKSAARKAGNWALLAALGLLALPARADLGDSFKWMLPESASSYAPSVDRLYFYLIVTTGTAFAIVICAVVYLCVRYRHREGRKAYYTHGNSWSATALTLFLAMTVFTCIDLNVVRMSNAAAKETQTYPDDAHALHIQVLAQQFNWRFHYAGPDGKFGHANMSKDSAENFFGLDTSEADARDDITSEGSLCVPVNTPVILEIRAKDVIHSFFIPNFRIKQDAVPGMKTQCWFMATKVGDYDVACAQLCGMMHSQMHANLMVREQKEYEEWLKDHAP